MQVRSESDAKAFYGKKFKDRHQQEGVGQERSKRQVEQIRERQVWKECRWIQEKSRVSDWLDNLRKNVGRHMSDKCPTNIEQNMEKHRQARRGTSTSGKKWDGSSFNIYSINSTHLPRLQTFWRRRGKDFEKDLCNIDESKMLLPRLQYAPWGGAENSRKILSPEISICWAEKGGLFVQERLTRLQTVADGGNY